MDYSYKPHPSISRRMLLRDYVYGHCAKVNVIHGLVTTFNNFHCSIVIVTRFISCLQPKLALCNDSGLVSICRHVGASGGPEIPRAIPPQALCAVLSSPQLIGKKNVGNVEELFQLLQV